MNRAVHRFLWPGLAWGVWICSLQLTAACGSDDEAEHDEQGDEHGDHEHAEPVGPPSGADCPEGSTLTYKNFGEQFMKDYCLRCHSASVTGAARMKAPADHNFDTLAEIDLLADHIDQMAAKGPDSTNVMMPPSGAKPSDADRAKLGEWLECGPK